MRYIDVVLPFVMLVSLVACSGPAEIRRLPEKPGALRTNEALNAVLWTQTAAEYRASAQQAYQAARVMLERALADDAWTAALDQVDQADYASLPPAVVLDVDETVLDNAPYQARLVLEDAEYARDSWNAWVEERQATPIPGALAFTRFADSLGVTVIYLTNRRHYLEEATRDNLARYGFPLDPAEDIVLTRGEQEAWATGDKGSRRAAVAQRHRILLLVGDNLGDFLSGVDTTVAARQRLVDRYRDYWGTRWIVLPNPLYGSWEDAVIDFEYGLPRSEKLQIKYDALEPVDQ